MERAFEAHLDMMSRDIEKLNLTSLAHVQKNLQNGLKNAFEMVAYSDMATASAQDVLSGFHSLAKEFASYPMGLGRTEEIDRAKEIVLQRIAILRKELHNCPPSPVAKALMLE